MSLDTIEEIFGGRDCHDQSLTVTTTHSNGTCTIVTVSRGSVSVQISLRYMYLNRNINRCLLMIEKYRITTIDTDYSRHHLRYLCMCLPSSMLARVIDNNISLLSLYEKTVRHRDILLAIVYDDIHDEYVYVYSRDGKVTVSRHKDKVVVDRDMYVLASKIDVPITLRHPPMEMYKYRDTYISTDISIRYMG